MTHALIEPQTAVQPGKLNDEPARQVGCKAPALLPQSQLSPPSSHPCSSVCIGRSVLHAARLRLKRPWVGGWLAILAALPLCVPAADTTPAVESHPEREARMRWWREARFGLFLHWGPVSLTGLEISWSRANTNPKCPNQGPTPADVYDHLYERFNPTNFSAAEWAHAAQAAGMKYIVLTAKHCDGFLLWPSRADHYHIGNTPFPRDVCGELARAARRAHLKLGWYFSPMDWRDADFRTDRNAAFVGRMQAELRELLANYGPLDVMWFDWDGREPLYDQPGTYALVHKLQPRIIINNRLDLGVGNNDNQLLSPHADYYTPEQRIGLYDDQRPWETCMTLGTQWSWKPDDAIKSARDVVGILARTVGGDGNLLLNVGPMPDGRIEPRQVEVLRQVGAWLRTNGKSIYGTRGGPFKPSPALASTRKGNVVYLHVLKGHDGTLVLPSLPRRILTSRWLHGGPVPVAQTDTDVTLTFSPPVSQPMDRVIRLTLDGPAGDLPVLEVARPGLIRADMKATASNVFQNDPGHAPGKAIDGDDDTRWATDGGTKQAWLEVDLGRPLTFDRVEIQEAFAGRVQSFTLQWREGEQWRTFHRGSTLGGHYFARFDAVTAQRVRLNILDATDGPTITEFQLFPPGK
jgi:alpha-L-fucosidase